MKMPGNGQATVSIAASGLKCATQFSENIKFPTHTYTHPHTLSRKQHASTYSSLFAGRRKVNRRLMDLTHGLAREGSSHGTCAWNGYAFRPYTHSPLSHTHTLAHSNVTVKGAATYWSWQPQLATQVSTYKIFVGCFSLAEHFNVLHSNWFWLLQLNKM